MLAHTIGKVTIELQTVIPGRSYLVTGRLAGTQLRLGNLRHTYPTETSARYMARWICERLLANETPTGIKPPPVSWYCEICHTPHRDWLTSDPLYAPWCSYCPQCNRLDLELDALLDNA